MNNSTSIGVFKKVTDLTIGVIELQLELQLSDGIDAPAVKLLACINEQLTILLKLLDGDGLNAIDAKITDYIKVLVEHRNSLLKKIKAIPVDKPCPPDMLYEKIWIDNLFHAIKQIISKSPFEMDSLV